MAVRNTGWQCCRPLDPQSFQTPRLSTDDFHPGFGYSKSLRQKPDEVGIGLAIYWWRSNADFEGIFMGTDNFITAGPGLDPYGQEQVIILPLIPGRLVCHPEARPAPKSLIGAITRMVINCRTIITSKGDRSRPWIGGRIRRALRNTGSFML